MTAPCWHCPERHIGCHATCKAYGAYAAERVEVSRRRARDSIGRELLWTSLKRMLEMERRGRRARKPRKKHI